MSFVGLAELINNTAHHVEQISLNNIDSLNEEQKKEVLFSFLTKHYKEDSFQKLIFRKTSIPIISKLVSSIASNFSHENINDYLTLVNKLSYYGAPHFKDKVKLLLPLLNSSHLKSEHLNNMVHYLINTPQDVRGEKYDSSQSIEKYAYLFFNHPLFSSKENAVNVAQLYYILIDNMVKPNRKNQFSYIDSRNRGFKLTNSNFALFIDKYTEHTKHVVQHMNMDQLLFNSFLQSNIEYIENSHISQFNSLTYLVKKTEDKFPFNILISHYLEHSTKLINEKDLHHKSAIDYAKKGYFNYQTKPSYTTLIKYGATPIHNHFIELISSFTSIFNKKEKNTFVYQEKNIDTENEMLKKQSNKNVLDSMQKVFSLNIQESAQLNILIEKIGAIALNTFNKEHFNFDNNYLFIRETVLNYLPNFTQEFYKIYKHNPKKEFIDEYQTQINILHDSVIEKYELLNNTTDEAQLEKLKKNTQFLKAKQ